MHSPRQIIFTGALGRVGKRLVPLLRKKHSIVPVDVLDLPNGEAIRKIDLTERDQVMDGFAGAAAVIHCAIASHGSLDTDSMSDPEVHLYNERMIEVNIRGTYNVFEAARVHGIPRVVFISSLTTSLGEDRGHKYCPNRTPSPVNFYACTKLFGENLAEVYYRDYGVSCVILRLGQPYPLGIPKEKQWLEEGVSTSLFVTFPDIARAVDAALSSSVGFGRYNVVSRHQEEQVTVEDGKEIGFEPRDVWQPTLPHLATAPV